jgi:FMN-dependent NADH-azoreductase
MATMLGMVAGTLLAVALFIYIFWPGKAFVKQYEKSRLDDLLERKELLNENLRDLDFDYSTGKYPEENFQAQRTQFENEAAKLQSEIEHLQQA